jgi:Flp pilus assembly protein TadD
LAEAQYALGNGLAQQQQFEAAMNAYREALVIDPVYFLARNNLANCQLATGKLQDAVANYEEALRLQPNDESVRQNLEIARQLLRTDTNRP